MIVSYGHASIRRTAATQVLHSCTRAGDICVGVTIRPHPRPRRRMVLFIASTSDYCKNNYDYDFGSTLHVSEF